jgi:hypothetical protein
MPALAPERITMSDAFGSWTKATEDTTVVWYLTEPPPRAWPRTTSILPSGSTPFLGVRSDEGQLEMGFGCYTAVFPCLGMRVVEMQLDRPIQGFAGSLLFNLGWADPWLDVATLRENHIAYFGGVFEQLVAPCCSRLYDGFYGVLFDAPVTTLRFAWWEDSHPDDSTWFRFTNMVMIGVPEPSLLATFAAAALLLLAGGRDARVTPASFAWRRVRSRR